MPLEAVAGDSPLARFRTQFLYAADLAPSSYALRNQPPANDTAAYDQWLWKQRADQFRNHLAPLKEEYARRHQLEPTQAQIGSFVAATSRNPDVPVHPDIARELAGQWIGSHNFFRHLYRAHGGRVIHQQFGPEPLDALHKFWTDREDSGEFEFFAPELRTAFYHYFYMNHVIASPRSGRLMMETPWWEMTDSDRAALEEDDSPIEAVVAMPPPIARFAETIITREMLPWIREESLLRDTILRHYGEVRGIGLPGSGGDSVTRELEDRIIEEFGYDLHGLRGAIGRYAATLMRDSTLEFFDASLKERFLRRFPSQPEVTASSSLREPAWSFEGALVFDTAYLDCLLQAIDTAKEEILVAMQFGERGARTDIVLGALEEAAARGVRIRMLIGRSDTFAREIAGFHSVRTDSRIGERVVLIDRSRMLAGSHSWIDSDYSTRHHASILLVGPTEAYETWVRRFERRWEAATRIAPRLGVRFSTMPERGRMSRSSRLGAPVLVRVRGELVLTEQRATTDYPAALESLIRRSERRVVAANHYVLRRALERDGILTEAAALMAGATKRGVDARLLLCGNEESLMRGITDTTFLAWLRIRGISSQLSDGVRPHHLRVVLGDDRHLLVGSHLWSISSLHYNVETSILIDSAELATAMADYLARL